MMASRVFEIDHLIDGVDVTSPVRDVVQDPGRLSDTVAMVARGGSVEVDMAVKSARAAGSGWAATPYQERARLLNAVADLLVDRADPVLEVMARESGMLVATSRAEIGLAVNIVRDNVELAQGFLEPECFEDSASWVKVSKRPIGVIAAIVPWNAPIILTMRKLAPALICGNTVVIKPAPTAAVGLTLLLRQIAALLPPGVINVVHGGEEVGHALSTHPLVRKISFTGGGAVARQIMRDAAQGLKPVQFELGGNDPAIILDDADLDQAVGRIVGGAFRRSGQFCFAIKRVYAPASIHDEVVERIAAIVDQFVIGHPLTPGVTFGPINNLRQLTYLQHLRKSVQASGVKMLELGLWSERDVETQGHYMRPIIVPNAPWDAEIVQQEQFGPILPIVRYESVDAVVEDINASELGLGSSIWTGNADRATELAARLEVGMTFVNNSGTSRLGQRHMPFGGVKQSGIGRESSAVGLAEFVEYHAINLHK
jgi:acyl-CoA reductase-like NAD-dependent aldehyde dehydrogenase